MFAFSSSFQVDSEQGTLELPSHRRDFFGMREAKELENEDIVEVAAGLCGSRGVLC